MRPSRLRAGLFYEPNVVILFLLLNDPPLQLHFRRGGGFFRRRLHALWRRQECKIKNECERERPHTATAAKT